jgi:hypothetical protein
MTLVFSRSTLVVCAIALVTPCPQSRAQEPPTYLIYPVKTELQRELAPARANLLVILDTTSAVKDSRIALDALQLQNLGKALLPHKKGDTKLHFTLFFPKGDSEQFQAQNVLRYALMGFGHETGFPKVTAYGQWPNTEITWAEHIATLTGKARQAVGDEPASGNDLVKVYPVKTELSRYLTSDADCAVVVVGSLAKEQGVIPQRVRETTAELVGKLKLPHKRRVSFYLGHVPDEERQRLLNDFYQLAEGLGFETSSVTFR